MIGQSISHYRVLRKLGGGGMGVVYEAEDLKLHRHVALKFLPESLAHNNEALRRFEREARAASTLNHPNICTIYAIEEHENQPVIAMELIQGATLKERIAQAPLPLKELLELSIGICEGLSAAHAEGIVHRDIKPGNIFVTHHGTAKILDFGLAKLVPHAQSPRDEPKEDEEESQLTLTVPGAIRGTTLYMSPEQARGDDLDQRTDLFSFGVVMYEMATGKKPFQECNAILTIDAILNAEPRPVSSVNPAVPAPLEAIIQKALKKSCEQRYQTAGELLQDLKNLRQEIERSAALETAEIKSGPVVATGESGLEGKHARVVAAARTRRSFGPLWKVAVAASVTLGLVALAAIGKRLGIYGGSGQRISSIAVLPFANESANKDAEYLSDGLTEGIINDLTRIPALKVMARGTVFRYQGREVDPRQVGKELQVSAVVMGRLVQRGDAVTIQTELVKATDGTQIWGEQYNRHMDNLSAVQQEIVRDISENLRLHLRATDVKRLTGEAPVNEEAYRLYLKGRYLWNQRTKESLLESISYFNRAIDKDPRYAMAWVGLADAFNILPGYSTSTVVDSSNKAKDAAEKAIQLDDGSAEAHASLAMALSQLYDYQAAEREFKRALELNPNYANGHYFYAVRWLAPMGRLQEASSELKKALELDPLSLIANTNLGWIYFYGHRYDAAREQFERTAAMDPNFEPLKIGFFTLDEAEGDYGAAIEALGKISQPFPEIPEMGPERLAKLRRAYAVGGAQGYWRAKRDFCLEDLKHHYVSSSTIAIAYAHTGDMDAAFRWLKKAIEERDVLAIKVDPRYDLLRADPRFAELERTMESEPASARESP